MLSVLHHYICIFITCAHAASRYCFGDVCLSVCLSVHTKSRKLLNRNCLNLVGLCPMVTLEVFYSWLHLTLTFDFERYFRIFSNSRYIF